MMRCLSFLVLLCSSILAVTLAGCGTDKPSPKQYIGTWKLDLDDSYRRMQEDWGLTAEAAGKLRDRLIASGNKGSWTFREDNTYTSTSWGMISHGDYRIYDEGEDWVVLRTIPLRFEIEDDESAPEFATTHFEEVNAMNAQEIAEYMNVEDGSAPQLMGFKFVSNDQIRRFSIVVRDGKITDEHGDHVLYNRAD